ncbi:MAG: hypothetical protein ACJAZ2_000887 [Glaciecola sp.]|jgi:hypothetical protein
MMKINKILLSVFVLGVVIFACKKDEEEVVKNPYDEVVYSVEDTTVVDTLDKNELTSIHKEIFHPKCAVPGCHDGSFEPDFSTVLSSYSTLVYHPIVKNDVAESFTYRVVPGNSASSVLYERISNCCFVNTNDRMPQSSIGVALPDDDIARIKAWIDNGAKDISGKIATEPDNEPVYQYVQAIKDEGFPGVYDTRVLSVDSNRVGEIWYGAMVLDTNMNVVLLTEVIDDKTIAADLINGRLLLSYDKDDFSTPLKTINSDYLAFQDGKWYNTFSTSDILENTIVYMRYYINDGKHTDDTEYPAVYTPDYFKSYWSFIITAGSDI